MVDTGGQRSWWQRQVHDYQQQRSWVWRPVYNVHTMWFPFLCMGIIMSLGAAILLPWQGDYNEIIWDYTDCCNNTAREFKNGTEVTTLDNGVCTCKKVLNILPEDDDQYKWDRDILLYYSLENFHQNHRQYADSRDDKQIDGGRLKESDKTPDTPSTDCEIPHNTNNSLPIVPCGSIANTLFNDDVKLFFAVREIPKRIEDWKWRDVSLLRTNITMPLDKKRFNNPNNNNNVIDLKGKISKPRNWTKELWELDPDNDDNNGLENEDLIVWMRAAPMGNFRKLWRRVDHDNQTHIELKDGLHTAYMYMIEIESNYDVSGFDGRKKVIITRANYLGSKNKMRGYVVLGAAIYYLFFGALFKVLAWRENNANIKQN